MKAWRAREGGGVTFSKKQGYSDREVELPCGQCVGCKLDRSRQWAVRMQHEAALHDDNCFITLTYDDEFLPSDRSVDVVHFQKFMKRLRERVDVKFKFYHCGEYGDDLLRPHYHACLFGLDFSDKRYLKTIKGNRYFVSPLLRSIWCYGNHLIGEVTFESAAYVARYCVKKQTGEQAYNYYSRFDLETGEIYTVKPEYATQSNGIGLKWLERFHTDVWNGDSNDDVVINSRGHSVKPPRYYFEKYKEMDKYSRSIKGRRMSAARDNADENTPARLAVREKVETARLNLKRRSFDEDV